MPWSPAATLPTSDRTRCLHGTKKLIDPEFSVSDPATGQAMPSLRPPPAKVGRVDFNSLTFNQTT